MGTITIGVEDEIEEKFRVTVKESIGVGKGTLGKAFTQAMELWIKNQKQEEMKKRALKRLKKGYKLGKIKYKNRDELHERN